MDVVEQIYLGYRIAYTNVYSWLRKSTGHASADAIAKKACASVFRTTLYGKMDMEGPWIDLFNRARLLRDQQLAWKKQIGDRHWIDTIPVISDRKVTEVVKAISLVRMVFINRGLTLFETEAVARAITSPHPWPEVENLTKDLNTSTDYTALPIALLAAYFCGHDARLALRTPLVLETYQRQLRAQLDWNEFERARRA
jgi:hypothetical protein